MNRRLANALLVLGGLLVAAAIGLVLVIIWATPGVGEGSSTGDNLSDTAQIVFMLGIFACFAGGVGRQG